MANPDKDTIYVDIDDEITGIIDKVKNSSNKVVALVLPKRATVFQSIVNMKLLKKATEASNKNLVLITAEAGLLPLAGAAGIHVAKTLTSKPEIPSAPQPFADKEEAIDEDTTAVPLDNAEEVDPSKSVGELAIASQVEPPDDNGVETVNLDNTEPDKAETPAKAAAAAKAAKKAAPKKDKKLKVPNFERFRKYLIIGAIALVVIVVLFLVLGSTFAKATINVKTNSTNVNTSLNLVLSTTASAADPSSGTIPAKQEQIQKTSSQQVGTTGQQNNGNKASGSANLTAQACGTVNLNPTIDLPAGSGLTSNNQTYITQNDTTFSNFSQHQQHGCVSYQSDNPTQITAQNPGSSFNTSGTFTAPGNYSGYSISGTGSASGGTDNIVQTVNQNDINNAKSKISMTNSSSVKSTLQSQLNSQGYYPITSTYNAGTPVVTTSSNVGSVANSVTVTETINYTMFGVHQSDLKALVDNSVDGQIDTSKQSILSEGLNNATFTVNSLTSTGGQVSMNTVAVAGPQLDINGIKQAAAGKKAGPIESLLNTYPGVTSVNVKISPFWSSTAPSNTSKITINVAKPTTTTSSS